MGGQDEKPDVGPERTLFQIGFVFHVAMPNDLSDNARNKLFRACTDMKELCDKFPGALYKPDTEAAEIFIDQLDEWRSWILANLDRGGE